MFYKASFSSRCLPVSIKGLNFASDYDAWRVSVKVMAKTNINIFNKVLRSNVDSSALFKGLYLAASEILLTHTHTHTHRRRP